MFESIKGCRLFVCRQGVGKLIICDAGFGFDNLLQQSFYDSRYYKSTKQGAIIILNLA